MSKKWFANYYAKLSFEGFLKALLSGLVFGLSVLTLVSASFWFTGFKLWWVAFIAFGAVTALVTPFVYYKKFKPTQKAIAKRVDELGLEERLLTMTQLEGDNSYMANRQREDAMRALKFANAHLLKVAVSVPLIIAVSVLTPISAGATVMAALVGNDTIKSGQQLVEESQLPDPKFWDVEFVEVGEGVLDGEIFQRVENGKTLTEVVAIPEDGWYIDYWSWVIPGLDGVEQEYVLKGTDVFYVEDFFITQDLTITAVFAEAQEGEGEGQGEGEEGEEGEESDEGEPKESESQESSDSEGEDSDQPSDEPGGDQAGGKYQPNHGVIDGNTDYGDMHENAEQDALDELGQSDDIPGGVKDIIKDYFDNIEK